MIYICIMTSKTEHSSSQPAPLSGKPQSGNTERRRINVKQLLDGRPDVVLVHGPDEYILRITSKGGLILTK